MSDAPLFEDAGEPSSASPETNAADGPGGTITKIEPQVNDADRVSVFVDGAFAFGLHRDVLVKHGLTTGQELTIDVWQAVETDEQLVQAKQRALDYLAYKPRTETEVRRKLREEDYSPVVVEDAVARLEELGYLDDEQYAHDYAHNRFSNKGYGPVRIRRELVKRGIDRHLADGAVDRVFDDEDPVDAARTHAEKRWPRLAGADDPRRQKQKLYNYLKRRGFTSDTIYRVLDEFISR